MREGKHLPLDSFVNLYAMGCHLMLYFFLIYSAHLPIKKMKRKSGFNKYTISRFRNILA